jgi:steroid 5-alpha reductase family enzyme
MMDTVTLQLLALNFAILAVTVLLLWGVAIRLRDASFIDAFWAFGMVMMALASWLHAGPHTPRGNILLALVAVWGLRLSEHLFTRWRANGEDPRYKMIIGRAMEKNGWSWNTTALIMVFAMQAPLLFITCLPAQIGIFASRGSGDIGLLAFIGIAAAVTGIVFETIGDAQLKSFKADPANAGKVMDSGLWRYTRHPNYFGDFAAWWGIWLVTADAGLAAAAASIIGPLFLSFTLMKWSGGPMLERGMKKTRPEYADYVARTSAFFPWLPKR